MNYLVQAFAKRVEEANLGPIENLTVVYIRDGEPQENALVVYSGKTISEKIAACASECDDIIHVVNINGDGIFA